MSSALPDFEHLCEFALSYLMQGRGDARVLAAQMVQDHPDLPVLELVLVLSAAASGLERAFSNIEARELAVDAWRIAALLAVDVHLSGGARTGRQLLDFWQEEDDFFLRPCG